MPFSQFCIFLLEYSFAFSSKIQLNYTRGMVEDFQKNKPWIPEEDLEKLVTMVDEVEGWLGNKTKEQEGLELHEEPAFKSKQLLKKLNPIAKYSKELLKRRKPAEKKPKKAKKNATESASNETQNEQEEKSEDEKVEEKAEEDKTEEKEAPEAEAQESTGNTLEACSDPAGAFVNQRNHLHSFAPSHTSHDCRGDS